MTLEERLQKLSTQFILRELMLARVRNSNHPLFRRWSYAAYDGRFVSLAESIPEQLAQILPLTLITAPFLAFIVILLFGTQTLATIATIIGLLLLIAILMVAAGGTFITASLGALAVADEREAGRWELMMILPRKRIDVLMMRISTILFPYRPLVDTLNLLQTIAALMMTFVFIGQVNRSGDDVFGTCVIFLLPTLFLLTMERRQDFALSVAIGSYAGLARNRDTALGWAMSGVVALMAARLMAGMVIFAFAPWERGLFSVFPSVVAGPSVLSLLSASPLTTVLVLMVYYGLRELTLSLLWRTMHNRLIGWEL